MRVSCPKCLTKHELSDEFGSPQFQCPLCKTWFSIERAKPKGADAERQDPRHAPTRMPSDVKPPEGDVTVPPPAKPKEADPLIGTTLGAYRIVRRLGRGGMGVVYEARQISLARDVALKVLPPVRAADKEYINRFVREARSAAKLNHPNIVQIYDVGKAGNVYFFSMELVRGGTLRDLLSRDGPLSPERAVKYVVEAARGLEYAHSRGIIHRDVKPDNIMIDEHGRAKVADLGLAKGPREGDASMTSSGVAMGTPHYMAPEQATDAKHADHRADIYSLGCTLYHLVTGRVPYHGTSAFEIVIKHVNEPLMPAHVANPNVSEELSRVIDRMTAKKAANRYGSMGEVIAALEGQAGQERPRTTYHADTQQVTKVRAFAESLRKLEQTGRRQERTAIIGLTGGALAIVTVIGFAIREARLVAATGMYAALSIAFYWTLAGAVRGTYLYRRVRQTLAGNGVIEWAVLGLLTAGAILLIVFLKLMVALGITAVLAAGTAALYYWAGRQPMLVKRDAELEKIRGFVDMLRERGMSLEDCQLFLCEHGGAYGEIACEELYGYEAMAAAVAKCTKSESGRRPLEVRTRALLVRWLDSVEAWRKRRAEATILRRERAAAVSEVAQTSAGPTPAPESAAPVTASAPQASGPEQTPAESTPAPEVAQAPVAPTPVPESAALAQDPEPNPSEPSPEPEAGEAPSGQPAAPENAATVPKPEQAPSEPAPKSKKKKTPARPRAKRPSRKRKAGSE
jgi:serine/threonine protein kinase